MCFWLFFKHHYPVVSTLHCCCVEDSARWHATSPLIVGVKSFQTLSKSTLTASSDTLGSAILCNILCPYILFIVLTSHVYVIKSNLPLSSLRLGGLELSTTPASPPSRSLCCVMVSESQWTYAFYFFFLIQKDRPIKVFYCEIKNI